MKQGRNRTRCKTNILKPEPDIKKHADRRNNYCNHSIPAHLSTYCRADVLRHDLLCVYIKLVCQRFIQCFTLCKIQSHRLNHNLVCPRYFLRLHVTVTGYLFYHRHNLLIYLINGEILCKCNIGGCTAFKFQAVRKRTVSSGAIHTHKCKPKKDDPCRNSEKYLLLPQEMDRCALLLCRMII
ncbi:hypothetical protein IMSAGC015_02413 [Lachnospiraceae bacterium]|nr:hypothetical protein IMSAGC015_02413 [Lachnospiraceae bacterium]